MKHLGLIVGLLVFCVTVGVMAATVAATPSADEQARAHYFAGEAALKAGDLITTVAEWETTLQLKPTSMQTQTRLAETRAKLSPQQLAAYEHYRVACECRARGDLDGADRALAAALAAAGSQATCIVDLIKSVAVDRQKRHDTGITGRPVPIVIHGASNTDQRTIQGSATSATTQQRSPSATSPDLEIVRFGWSQPSRSGQITRVHPQITVRNTSTRRLSHIRVRLVFYDLRTGQQESSQALTCSLLMPGATTTLKSERPYDDNPKTGARIADHRCDVVEIQATREEDKGPGLVIRIAPTNIRTP